MSEGEARHREQLLQGLKEDIFDMAGDSIFIIDAGTMRIVDVNDNAARRLGYSRAELLQMSLSDIEEELPETTPAGAASRVSTVSRTRIYECVHRRRDGDPMFVEVSSRPASYAGKAVHLHFSRDNTARKQIEAQREALIGELDAYAHTVAHDLKNPVAVVMGYSEMALRSFEELSDEDQLEFLTTIHRTSVKMRDIINELLLLASVRKVDEVPTVQVEMETVVEEALIRLASAIEETGAKIVKPGSWPAALGYGPWIEEVWTNYISNALKYGGEPSRVEVGATPRRDGYIVFWVRDNGPGLTQAQQDQLFAPFTRIEQARAEGHGLGLSIVLRIVEKLGGTVGVTSAMGKGSTFAFTLPAAQ